MRESFGRSAEATRLVLIVAVVVAGLLAVQSETYCKLTEVFGAKLAAGIMLSDEYYARRLSRGHDRARRIE
jgi:hypothetical protein